MTQQINLFNPIFLKREKYFSAVRMLQGLGLVLLGSVVVVAYARFQLSDMRVAAESSGMQLKAARMQLAKVTADYGPREKNKALEEDVKRMEAELRVQRQAYDVVQRGSIGNSKGYSEYLRAFARQSISGLWLTEFRLNGAGTYIELHGNALRPELVPQYLARLKTEPTLQGKSFAALEMGLPETTDGSKMGKEGVEPSMSQRPSYVTFVLRSTMQQPEQGGVHALQSGGTQ
ncbi:MSHA biogenesis protein MshI [Oxalobacteraceae bacterium OM1]|nr:MSHA biogenesis protein MshI [Oxalobacteraceae bacterium OM1]